LAQKGNVEAAGGAAPHPRPGPLTAPGPSGYLRSVMARKVFLGKEVIQGAKAYVWYWFA